MSGLRIPNGGIVIVADGHKAILLRNDGGPDILNLVAVETMTAPDNPSTAEQGADAPGRGFSGSDSRRSAVEQTDWHRIAQDAFARQSASALDRLCGRDAVQWLALIAPPRVLAEWRKHLADGTRKVVKAEISKELTNHPIHEIERIIAQP